MSDIMTDLHTSLATFIAQDIARQPGLTLTTESALISSGLIDSFHLVDLALHIEQAYGVRLDDTELNTGTFDTLGQLVTLIEQRR
jgi:acyl carrier protein